MHGRTVCFIGIALLSAHAVAGAQTKAPRSEIVEVADASLPEAPQLQGGAQQGTGDSPSTNDHARVSGVVVDQSGASVAGAEVTLLRGSGSQLRTVKSGTNGRFSFEDLPADSYVINVRAKGFSPFVSDSVVIAPQQMYELPTSMLAIASTSSEITVLPTEQIAAEQIRAEEKQRVFGVFPSYFTSYVYDAAPLTVRQKFSLTAHDTFDPVSLLGVAAAAGLEQANRTYPGYGNDAKGYGKRFGAALGDSLTGDFLGHAVFPSLLHQDPRYFYQGSGTTKQRFYHAVSFALFTRSDSGGLKPNLSYILGDLTSGALSNLYYPHADRGVGLVFTNTAISIGGRAAGALVREFLSKRITTNVPGNGKP